MPSQQNQDMVKDFQTTIEKYKDFVVTANKGLSVADVTELRAKLREKGAVYHIVKNNIFKIALNNRGIAGLDNLLIGPNAVVFTNDAASSAKVLKEFLKDKVKAERLEIKAGFNEGKVVDKKYVEVLADLPTKEELIVRFIWGLRNPIQKFAYGLKALSDKLAQQQS